MHPPKYFEPCNNKAALGANGHLDPESPPVFLLRHPSTGVQVRSKLISLKTLNWSNCDLSRQYLHFNGDTNIHGTHDKTNVSGTRYPRIRCIEDKAKIVLEKILNCQMSKLGQSREPYYESIYVGDRTVLQIKGENIFVNAS